MQVKDALSGLRAIVDDDPIAVRQLMGFGQSIGQLEGVAEERGVPFGCIRQGGEVILGNDEQMGGRLRVDVRDRHELFGLRHDVRLHLSACDAAE